MRKIGQDIHANPTTFGATMNLCKKEKKRTILSALKPKSQADWVTLGEKIFTWAHRMKSQDIDDFARQYGYNPYALHKWAEQEEVFKEYFQAALYAISKRRNAALRNKDNLIMRTQHIYDLRLKDIEDAQRKQEHTINLLKGQPLYEPVHEKTKELDDHLAKKDKV